MDQIIALINEMSPFLLLGFFLAGLMHVFIPGGIYSRFLSGNSFRSVVYASLFGIPLPLCSCGVLPTAMSLRREGASKGATVSFLIATPQTGVDSIITTYSLMGLPFAIVRPIAALITSLLGGQLVNMFDRDNTVNAADEVIQPREFRHLSLAGKLVEALRYGFVEMMSSIGRWLIIGLVVAGLITVFVPDDFFMLFADKPVVSMLLVLMCAIPMYLCATGSIPIAVALMLKGLSPGTALVLLMAGPAANFASILVINKGLGHKTLFLYLGALIAGAMTLGLAIDYLLPREWFVPTIIQATGSHCADTGVAWFNVLCTIALCALLANVYVSKWLKRRSCNNDSCCCHANKTQADTCETSIHNEPTEKAFAINGMHCIHCAKGVKLAIASIEGVDSVTVDLEAKRAVVKGTASDSDIIKAIDSIGFSACRDTHNLT